MRYLYFTLIIIIIILLSSCRKDFSTELSNGKLSFSKDTVFFNRVFDNISSSTHRFTVKNNSSQDISIPSITLARGENSFYRINVDGIDGKSFEDITILAKDSIYVFLEATIDFDQIIDPEFMYRDQLLFDNGTKQQKVELEALVLDVNLIRPSRTAINNGFEYEQIILGQNSDGEDVGLRGTNLTENATWTNNKPYLVYNYIGVPSGKTLTIEKGCRVYFHNNSGIIVQSGGKLIINGSLSTTDDLENQVIIQGDRLEDDFAEVAGQWGTIWFMEGSENSEINNTTIKNATIGLLIDSDNSTQTLTLNNSQIYNTSSFGLFTRNAKVTLNNAVISNNGDSSISFALGGTYNLTHCTIANYWRNSSRQTPTLSINDSFETQSTLYVADLEANFTNCVIYGSQIKEFLLENKGENPLNFKFKNCLIKFNDVTNELADNPLYDLTNTTHFESNYFNENPVFLNTDSSEEAINLIIGDDSFAINKTDTSVLSNPIFQTDILGISRTDDNSDIGAYQHITFPEEN